MKNLKISLIDPFDYDLSYKGFRMQLEQMQTEIFNYGFSWTVLWDYKDFEDYADRYAKMFTDDQLFLGTEDPLIIHTLKVRKLLMALETELENRVDFKWYDDPDIWKIIAESERYAPPVSLHKDRESYPKRQEYYEQTLRGQIAYLYHIACMFSVSRYNIPKVLKWEFRMGDASSLKLLKHEDEVVAIIANTIVLMMDSLKELQDLYVVKPARVTSAA